MRHLLLLHGAIGAKDQLMSLKEQLSHDFVIHAINFSGHGGEPIPEEPFSIELFANNVFSYMEKENIQQTNIFGYSMGGYVGMHIARHNPAKISKLVTLATKFKWDEKIAADEIKMIDPELIIKKVPAFAKELEIRHTNWQEVLHKTSDMLKNLGQDNTLKETDYLSISIPALLLVGDRDKMITVEETTSVFKKLPNAEMGVLPNTPHPFAQVDPVLLAILIRRFLNVFSPGC